MKRIILICLLLSAHIARPQQPGPSPSAVTPAGPDDLKNVLAEMNRAAASFKSAQADFVWDQYQAVVNESDTQKGTMYLKRTKNGIDAALRITSPDEKQVIFKNGKLSFYQPKIDQVTERDESRNRADVESFMSLGFGARGDDLLKSYDVKMVGWETLDGVKTAKLDLIPKAAKLKSSLTKVVLWIEPTHSLAVQQQFLEPSGDYRLAHYRNVKINAKIPETVFTLKTTANTKIVTPG
jgi:outer membrane lipoprotein-sorting protein